MNERIFNINLTGEQLLLIEKLIDIELKKYNLDFMIAQFAIPNVSDTSILAEINNKMNFLSDILGVLKR